MRSVDKAAQETGWQAGSGSSGCESPAANEFVEFVPGRGESWGRGDGEDLIRPPTEEEGDEEQADGTLFHLVNLIMEMGENFWLLCWICICLSTQVCVCGLHYAEADQ